MRLKREWPPLVALVLSAGLLGSYIWSSVHQNGRWVYALDDAYIHLAISKNLAFHGVWGLTPEGFSSSTSSVSWPLLLATTAFSPWHELTPLLLNLVAVVAVLFLSDRLLRRFDVPASWRFACLASMVLLLPFGAMVFTGLEHMAHLAVAIAILLALPRGPDDARSTRPVALLCGAASLVRYEGALLAAAVAIVLFAQGRRAAAAASLAFGAMPIVLFGLSSLALGWSFLPHSILLKSIRHDPTSFEGWRLLLTTPLNRFRDAPQALAVFVPLLSALVARRDALRIDGRAGVLAVYILTAFFHMTFASIGWFYRYEAYLIGSGVLLLPIAFREFLPTRMPRLRRIDLLRTLALLVVGVLVLVPLLDRAEVVHARTVRATTNIFEQQYQMGQFLRSHYAGATVAVNDVGAVAYYGGVRVLDLWGLGSKEPGDARLAGGFNSVFIRDYVEREGGSIAIVYDHWFAPYGGIPVEWRAAGTWITPRNVVLGGDAVTFYATSDAHYDRLVDALRVYESRLPAEVAQRGPYTVEDEPR